MNYPDRETAEWLLCEGERMNPGGWGIHSRLAAQCAEIIAENAGMDAEKAYSLALLHDIGRRFGRSNQRHTFDGYRFMSEQGWEESAKICLTHSYILKTQGEMLGENDLLPDESRFVDDYIRNAVYDDYDKLMQLCDYLSHPGGICTLERRMVDVALRYGFNELTIPRWAKTFELKSLFDKKCGRSIYSLLPIELA